MSSHIDNPDVVLIGSGIMSANLGALLKRLDPTLRIQVYEAADELAYESSNGWNNAGTGHAGICEISYTPKPADGSPVKVQKVIDIFQEFEHSLQFWGHAVASGMIDNPKEFINPLQHISFVDGDDQVKFLKSRYDGMKAHHFFASMEFTTDHAKVGSWAPLLTEGRDPKQPIAATKMDGGTDINFGNVSRKLLAWLGAQEGCSVLASTKVVDLKRPVGRGLRTPPSPERQAGYGDPALQQTQGAGWNVTTRNLKSGEERTVTAKFVFVGAGGGSILLLQKAGLPEAKGLGGFPIGGHWLVCDKPEIVSKHQAKVYGANLPEAPTMAVPHLDTRILDGKKTLLFGPFAAFTTRFLHRTGSKLDLLKSIKPHNLMTLLKIGATNIPLTRYLVQQGTQSMADRMKVMHIFYPTAKAEDWKLVDGGIRVQAIKKTDGEAGIVHFGTEVLTSADKSMSALLGASPGASVSVNIVMEVVKTSFPHLLAGEEGKKRIEAIIPTYGTDYRKPEHAARFNELATTARKQLKLV